MATPSKQGKTMSSRLLTMKFMQRSATSTPSTPEVPSEPPSKKQRLSNGAFNPSPSSIARSDAQTVKEALAAEELKRVEAREREGVDRGETRWCLNVKDVEAAAKGTPIRIVSAGYSTLDAANTAKGRSLEDVEDDNTELTRPQMPGRRSFGRFNKAVEKSQNPDLSSSESDSEDAEDASEEDEDDSDDPTGAKALISQSRKEAGDKARTERKARRKADKAEAARLAEERRKKHVKLNHLTSISANSGGSPTTRDVNCHTCGKRGHLKKDCPQAAQQRSRRK